MFLFSVISIKNVKISPNIDKNIDIWYHYIGVIVRYGIRKELMETCTFRKRGDTYGISLFISR